MKRTTPEQQLAREIAGLVHDLQAIDEEARNHPDSIERNRPGRFLIEQRLAEKRRQLKHLNDRRNLREHALSESMASDFDRIATPMERIGLQVGRALGTLAMAALLTGALLVSCGAAP